MNTVRPIVARLTESLDVLDGEDLDGIILTAGLLIDKSHTKFRSAAAVRSAYSGLLDEETMNLQLTDAEVDALVDRLVRLVRAGGPNAQAAATALRRSRRLQALPVLAMALRIWIADGEALAAAQVSRSICEILASRGAGAHLAIEEWQIAAEAEDAVWLAAATIPDRDGEPTRTARTELASLARLDLLLS